MKKKLLLIKLGGSVITDKSKPFTAKPATIKRLGEEIVQIQKDKNIDTIVAHGSGSYGHTVARKHKTPQTYSSRKQR